MKVELKNVKYAAFASQETYCFEATVYIDGKRCGTVSNEGYGGPDSYSTDQLRVQLESIAKGLPPIDMTQYGSKEPLPQSAETLIGQLMEDYLEQRQIKRLCAKKTLFRIPQKTYEPGLWSTLTRPFSPEVKSYLVQKYGTDVRILNENPSAGMD